MRSVSQACAVALLIALRTGMRAAKSRTHMGSRFRWVLPHTAQSRENVNSLRDVPLTPKAMALINKMRGYDPKLVVGLTAASLDANFRGARKSNGSLGFHFTF